jgi:hypothetical protein
MEWGFFQLNGCKKSLTVLVRLRKRMKYGLTLEQKTQLTTRDA